MTECPAPCRGEKECIICSGIIIVFVIDLSENQLHTLPTVFAAEKHSCTKRWDSYEPERFNIDTVFCVLSVYQFAVDLVPSFKKLMVL